VNALGIYSGGNEAWQSEIVCVWKSKGNFSLKQVGVILFRVRIKKNQIYSKLLKAYIHIANFLFQKPW